VSAYIKTNKVVVDKLSIPVFSPHHQIKGEDDTDEKEIRKQKTKIETDKKALFESISNFHLKNIRAILNGTDDVSQAIAPLKSFIKSANGKQLNRARLRKELGNPPGKKGDPLGDQISWEQLLDHVPGKRSIWIVTNDNDFFEKAEKEIFLNPFLRDELLEQASNIEINCFDNLADFFDRFDKSGLTPTALSVPPERIKEAKEEYQANAAVAATSSLRATCPRCGQLGFDIAAVVANPSMDGGGQLHSDMRGLWISS